jgi:hypothetical protein
VLYVQDNLEKMAKQASAAQEQAAGQDGSGSKTPEDGWGAMMPQFKDWTLDGEGG